MTRDGQIRVAAALHSESLRQAAIRLMLERVAESMDPAEFTRRGLERRASRREGRAVDWPVLAGAVMWAWLIVVVVWGMSS